MHTPTLTTVTILFYEASNPVSVLHEVLHVPSNTDNRVVIPQEYKEGRLIIAVLKGEVSVLNTMGQRWGDYQTESVKDASEELTNDTSDEFLMGELRKIA